MSNEGQEWVEWEMIQETVDGEPYKPASYAIREKRLGRELETGLHEAFALQVTVDHRDAQQLRERVRVLEEALRECEKSEDDHVNAVAHDVLRGKQ